jgi:hypothetical protein
MILITMIGAVLIVGSRVHGGPMHPVFNKILTKIPEIPSAPPSDSYQNSREKPKNT